MVEVVQIRLADRNTILNAQENYFLDLKGRQITPAKLSRTISAFANSSGGEVFVGIEEQFDGEHKKRHWNGFDDPEAANAIFQIINDIDPLGSSIFQQFLYTAGSYGLVLHLTVAKMQSIVKSTDGAVYIRSNAQNLPVKDENIERLKLDKGLKSYEDEIVNVKELEITNSRRIISFLIEVVPTAEPEVWIRKQFVTRDERPTVAGVLLFSDSPQAVLPKRSAVKILRYKTKVEAERDFLAFDPITVEGPLYDLIYDSVEQIKKTIEKVEKVGSAGLEKVTYPEEAVHELLTNAILHRDYSIPADVQVRIFDNRVEIESPGRLPGHVTISNIATTQFARNPKIVRLINKFKNPPNKDVGEGINTAFEAMEKLRLKKPEFVETSNSLIVTLRHESLASPESLVIEYLKEHNEITNQIARELTGIKSENTMKNVFYRLRDSGQLEQTPKIKGRKHSWRKPPKVE